MLVDNSAAIHPNVNHVLLFMTDRSLDLQARHRKLGIVAA
jgi:hypothetical protein